MVSSIEESLLDLISFSTREIKSVALSNLELLGILWFLDLFWKAAKADSSKCLLRWVSLIETVASLIIE